LFLAVQGGLDESPTVRHIGRIADVDGEAARRGEPGIRAASLRAGERPRVSAGRNRRMDVPSQSPRTAPREPFVFLAVQGGLDESPTVRHIGRIADADGEAARRGEPGIRAASLRAGERPRVSAGRNRHMDVPSQSPPDSPSRGIRFSGAAEQGGLDENPTVRHIGRIADVDGEAARWTRRGDAPSRSPPFRKKNSAPEKFTFADRAARPQRETQQPTATLVSETTAPKLGILSRKSG